MYYLLLSTGSAHLLRPGGREWRGRSAGLHQVAVILSITQCWYRQYYSACTRAAASPGAGPVRAAARCAGGVAEPGAARGTGGRGTQILSPADIDIY